MLLYSVYTGQTMGSTLLKHQRRGSPKEIYNSLHACNGIPCPKHYYANTEFETIFMSRLVMHCVTRDRWICAIHRLRCAIDGSIDCAPIERSRNHLSIAHYCACAIDGWNMLHVLWCETVLQLLRHYLKPVASFTTIASC